MKTLAEILAALRAYVDANAETAPKELQAALRSDFQEEVFTPLVGIGVTKGKKEVAGGDLKKAMDANAQLTADLATANERNTEMEKKAPEVEAVRAEFRGKITALQAAHKAELAEQNAKLTDAIKSREKAAIARLLAGVVEDFAVDSLADKADKLLHVTEDGKVELMGVGGVALGFADDADAQKAFLKEITKGVNPKLMLAQGDSGSDIGARRGAGGGAGARLTSKAVIAEESQEKAQQVGYQI